MGFLPCWILQSGLSPGSLVRFAIGDGGLNCVDGKFEKADLQYISVSNRARAFADSYSKVNTLFLCIYCTRNFRESYFYELKLKHFIINFADHVSIYGPTFSPEGWRSRFSGFTGEPTRQAPWSRDVWLKRGETLGHCVVFFVETREYHIFLKIFSYLLASHTRCFDYRYFPPWKWKEKSKNSLPVLMTGINIY